MTYDEANEIRDARDALFGLCDAIAEGNYLAEQRGTPDEERLVEAYQRAIDIVYTTQDETEKNELRDVLFELCDAIAEGGCLAIQRKSHAQERLLEAYQRAIDIAY